MIRKPLFAFHLTLLPVLLLLALLPKTVSAQQIIVQENNGNVIIQKIQLAPARPVQAIQRRVKTGATTPSPPKSEGVESSQTTPEESALRDDEQARQGILKQHERVEKAAASLEGKEYRAAPVDGKLLVVASPLELGHVHDGTENGSRFLVAELGVLNLTDKPVILRKTDVSLKIEEKVYPQSELNSERRNFSFSLGDTHMSFSDLKRPDEVSVEPGQWGKTWVLFYGLDFGTSLPKSSIEVKVADETRSLRLDQQILGQLGFETRRIGPDQALAIYSISGRVNLATLGVLADQVDKLVAAKVSRLVIAWEKGAPNVESNVAYYLYRYAVNSGRERNEHHDQRFPVLPNALREIHLCNMPGSSYSSNDGKVVTHDNLSSAVAGALWSALEKLPEDALLDQVERGDPLVRPAALSAGSARMSAERLPLVLRFLREDQPVEMRKAAIYALRHFGTPQALEVLIGIVRDGPEEYRSLAVASLAASRFDRSQAALLKLVNDSEGESRVALLKELAKAPLPAWAEIFYRNVVDRESPIRVESLQALNRIGHSQMTTLLKQALFDEQAPMRDAAFQLILERRDPELEPLLERIVLEKLAQAPPDGSLQNYLRQTRNAKALPFLLKHLREFKKEDGNRQNLIRLLVEIGDDTVAEELYGLYGDLSGYERGQVLTALQQMQSPRFMELALKALRGKDSSEIYAAINSLQLTDSREAEGLLIEMFENDEQRQYHGNLGNALSQIGSADAEKALRKARKSPHVEKRQVAIQSLRYLMQRRPGYQYIYQVQNYMRQKQFKEALESVNAAVDIDDSVPLAHSLRGQLLLQGNRLDESEEAFQKAVSIDPEFGESLVGLQRVALRRDPAKVAETLEKIAVLHKDFEGDYDYEYQAALAHADVRKLLTAIAEADRTPEQQALLAKCETDALQYLSQSVRHGMSDRQLIESAPELEPFKEHPLYSKALQGQLEEQKPESDETAEPKAPPAEAANDGDVPKILRTSGVIMLPAPPIILE